MNVHKRGAWGPAGIVPLAYIIGKHATNRPAWHSSAGFRENQRSNWDFPYRRQGTAKRPFPYRELKIYQSLFSPCSSFR